MAFAFICALSVQQLQNMHEGLDLFAAEERRKKSWNVPEGRIAWARLHWQKQAYNIKRKLNISNKVGQLGCKCCVWGTSVL